MEKGGWTPVIRRKRIGIQGHRTLTEGLFTIFVDDIPNSMDPKRLFSMFGKFEVVKEVFIPTKRRQGTGTRFGFVRYDCRVTENMVIQKANGLWCDNKALRVKQTDYQKREHKVGKELIRGEEWEVRRNQKIQRRRSYAEVVQKWNDLGKDRLVVKAREVGNEWLYESLLVSLKAYLSFIEFKSEVKERMK
ncbi:hypothetical protein ACSBR1_036197 [Camellia fascicularis]